MEALNIQGTDDSPKVILDAENKKMEISGRSLPEDVSTFYKPIIEWVNDYSKHPNPLTVLAFKLDYFNTASSKNILNILLKLKDIQEAGNDVLVEWHYQEDDDDMLETGVEYARVVKIPFKNIRY
jgi:hypothetical protein